MLAPELLSDDVLGELATDRRSVVPDDGDHPVTVRLPKAGEEIGVHADAEPVTLQPEVNKYEVQPEYSIAASYLGSLIEEDAPGDVVVDHTGQYVTYYPPEDVTELSDGSSRIDSSHLPRNVFGDVVHKAVELGVDPEDDSALTRLAKQFAVQHGVDNRRVDDDDIVEMRRHLRTAREYLSGIDFDHSVEEKPVRATLESGEVYGDIDYLAVTDNEYHIVDYKTNNITDPASIEEKREFYGWQMKAYAVALYQTEPERDVQATLLFTKAGEPRQFEWTPNDLADLRFELEEDIRSSLSTFI
jgi:ATP-dependent helicase/nuclease subunit A